VDLVVRIDYEGFGFLGVLFWDGIERKSRGNETKEDIYFSEDFWLLQFFGPIHNLHLSSLHIWQK
jgi:hypothetical protein